MRYVLVILAAVALTGCACGTPAGTAPSAIGGVPYADLNLPGLRLPAPLTFGQTPTFAPQGYAQVVQPAQACAPQAPQMKPVPQWVPAATPAPASAAAPYCP